MHLSNSLTLTAEKKKLLSPLQSEDIQRHIELCIGKLNLFSCYPPQITITWILLCLQWSSVKWLIWIIMDQSQDVRGYGPLASIVSTQPISTSPLLKFPVSAVTKHGVRWLQLMWTQSSYLMANPHLSVKLELSNSPWNLHLRYWLPIAQSWRLTESVKLCVLQGRTDDYSSWLLDNAGFNTTAKN